MFSSHFHKELHDSWVKPLRAEVLTSEELAARAVELAQFYSNVVKTPRGAKLKQRFKENTRLLSKAYFAFAKAAADEESLTAGAEWLLDNYHVIDEQVKEIRRDLPRGYYRSLPKLVENEWRGFPRVYQLVCDYISHTDAVIEISSLTNFISAYQQENVLLMGELWAVPIMLRLALVENLRRLAQASLKVAEQRREAEKFCQEFIDQANHVGQDLLVALINKVQSQPKVLSEAAGHVLRRLRAKGGSSSLAVMWLDQQIREKGMDTNELLRQEQQSQAADQISFGNCVTSLKTIGNLNWRDWFESVCEVDVVLSHDPAGVYFESDFYTRDLYRHHIEKLARLSKKSEVQVAEELVEYANSYSNEKHNELVLPYSHIGYYLIDEGAEGFAGIIGASSSLAYKAMKFCKRNVVALYLGFITLVVLIGLCLSFAYSLSYGASQSWIIASTVLSVFVFSEFAIQFVQWIVTANSKPSPLPKFNFESGVPKSARTLIVVQTILNDKNAIEKTIAQMEIRAVGNMDEQLYYGVLADFSDASSETLPGDTGIISRGRELIAELNERYCSKENPRFFMLFRRRLYNKKEAVFMGWERKRGKIMEFNRLLRGANDTSFNVIVGKLEELRCAKYVITLDNDTQLPPDTAQKLVGTIAHPLNWAELNPETKIVTRGYSLIQPRVGITLTSSNATNYSSIYSGHSGLDPYTHTVADVYQDLFKEGSYIGKGIYDIDAFEKALDERFPENTLLSHDLIEGVFVRCGLASDIEVFDDFPARYHAQARRQHRWIRGDWQILPWIFNWIPNARGESYQNPLSVLSRWKILDNLRRSLYPIALFLYLLLLSAFAPGRSYVWVLALFIVLGLQVYLQFWRLIFNFELGYSASTHFYGVLSDILKNLYQVLLNLAFLAHQAWLNFTAITVTLYRMFWSKKHLLEWETAHAAELRLGGKFTDFLRFMWVVLPISFFTCLCGISTLQEGWMIICLLLFEIWVLSPVIAYCVSLPKSYGIKEPSPSDIAYIRKIAWRTWRYFSTFLKEEYNYLIPDNLQTVPKDVVAERTSPTNISLSILSLVSAYDLGFLPLHGICKRLGHIFESLSRLERYHGHFLNWYAIRDFRPLYPRYVSTVDSGNLIGHFIALRQFLLSFIRLPILTVQHVESISFLGRGAPSNIQGLIKQISSISVTSNLKNLCSVVRLLSFMKKELEICSEFERKKDLSELVNSILAIEELLSWSKHLSLVSSLGKKGLLPKKLEGVDRVLEGRSPSLSLIAKLTKRLLKLEEVVNPADLTSAEKELFTSFIIDLKKASEGTITSALCASSIAEQIEQMLDEVDFRFLFNDERKLLTIGYNLENGQKDNSYYDLLASEARLTSLVGIAKGELPQSHWFRLNRSLTQASGGKALLSWAGTMFEYLMPILVTKDFSTTLLSETYQAVVRTQQIYGKRKRIPWGISESGYSGVDFEKTYQYKAFGIPGLGLKRGLADDLVISPYSTAMALMIDAPAATANLKRMEREGILGEYGFYEAADYTPARLGSEEKNHIVRSFLAHHQGMSLISINNVINNGIFRERFHSDPSIKSCELLLQERFPTRIPVLMPHQAEVARIGEGVEEAKQDPSERISSPHTIYPRSRILSNGKYSVVYDNAGGGYSFYESELALTRYREDGLSNNWGTFFYVRDVDSRVYWSNTYQPTCVEPEDYEVIFSPDKVEYRRRDRGIITHTQATISPQDDVEVRRISLTNVSGRQRIMEITSYAEVCLSSTKADLAHPAFSKMFIESEYFEEYKALLFTRRPRNVDEQPMWLMHLLHSPDISGECQYETLRQRFIGRGGSIKAPRAMLSFEHLARVTGTVLDPIFALRCRVVIPAGERREISFATAFARSKTQIMDLARRYNEDRHLSRAFEMSWSHSDIELRHQQFSISRVHDYQHLANAIIYNVEALRGSVDFLAKNSLGQSGLWRLGISGDEYIVLFIINDPEQIKLAEEMLLAHEYLRLRGFKFDLVILNQYPGGYMQDLQRDLDALIHSGYSRDLVEKRGGVFLRAGHHLSEDEICLLYTVARVVINGSDGSLGAQLEELVNVKIDVPSQHRKSSKVIKDQTAKIAEIPLEYDNTYGGFSDDGKSYVIKVEPDRLLPRPWSNVIANKKFGFLITETGGGWTWADNCRENRLTAWSNDPVCDIRGEVIYIRDQESGDYWTPTPLPLGSSQGTLVTHSWGETKFKTEENKISSELSVHGSVNEQVKWWQIELSNNDTTARTLEIFLYVEWVLGVTREENYRYLKSGFDNDAQILFVQNPYHPDFSEQIVFTGSNMSLHSYTANRREFLGRNHTNSNPAVLEPVVISPRIGSILTGGKLLPVALSRSVGVGFDSCAALKVQVVLKPGEEQRVLFFLAKADSIAAAKDAAVHYRSIKSSHDALKEVKKHWFDMTQSVQVFTPDRSFDILNNGWLLYQTISSRLYGRTGFYQSSGAFGFRDQLQDSLALVWSNPAQVREQILLHASRQFSEGDVQHWWHPPTGKGIRTRISDNYLWLPYIAYEYVQATGDDSLFNERVSFIEAPLLEEGQNDAYQVPSKSAQEASILEHCLRAIDRGLSFGKHGLPLIGGGDWNDGFNLVGSEGRGESVWLGWFLGDLLNKYCHIAKSSGDEKRARLYSMSAEEIITNVERYAWDGYWYHRAYFDDGSPLGSANNSEGQIDSLAQTWSVISGLAREDRQKQSMLSLARHLVRENDKMICLLTPPFEKSSPNPGYIQSYPAGIRENGGQYTHAAAWVILAYAMRGDGEQAIKLFNMINPISHTLDVDDVRRYKAEPYVVCGDVYSRPPRTGSGGWSWYTGSSAWLYRIAIEHIIGLKLRGDYFILEPCVSAGWQKFSLKYNTQGVCYDVQFENPKAVQHGVEKVTVNGELVSDGQISLKGRSPGEIVKVVVLMG